MSERRLDVLVVCGALLAGCASFSDPPARPAAPPPVEAPPVSVHLSTTEQTWLEWANHWEPVLNSQLAGIARDAMWESGWVKPTQAPGFGRMLKLDIEQHRDEPDALLTVLTLFLWPTREVDRVDLQLAFLEEGRPRLTCKRSAEMTSWQEVFLVFVMPFHWPAGTKAELTRALALQCLADVLEQRHAASAS